MKKPTKTNRLGRNKMIFVSEIIYTGEYKNRVRPKKDLVVIRANDLDKACKKTYKFAREKWPYFRFEINASDWDKVL